MNQRVIDARKKTADYYLEMLSRRFADSNFKIITSTTSGAAANSIIEYTQQHDIDLIVMSSHGQSALSRWVYGNVAVKILRRAPCDTLMIRPLGEDGAIPSRRVMVPLDGSALSERALKPALALAAAWNLEVLLLRVSPPIFSGQDPESSHEFLDDIEEQLLDDAEAYLRTIKAARSRTSLSVQIKTASGPEAATIIDVAEQNGVDLIVMSSHGRSGIGLWLMGSVSEKVLRKAACATLIVRNE